MISPTSTFTALGPTVALAVTATSQTVDPGSSWYEGTGSAVRVVNDGTQTVHLEFGKSGTTPTATVAVSGGAAGSMPIKAGMTETFGFPPGGVLAAIAASTGSTIYVTPGEGV
jgi:hypothetical protein